MMLLATMHEIDQRHVPEKIGSLPILGSLRSFPWLVKLLHKQWPSMSYIDVWRAEIRGLMETKGNDGIRILASITETKD